LHPVGLTFIYNVKERALLKIYAPTASYTIHAILSQVRSWSRRLKS